METGVGPLMTSWKQYWDGGMVTVEGPGHTGQGGAHGQWL